MKLTSKPLALIILFVIFGGIAFTIAMNWWQTETTKVPAVYTEGEAAGQYNPADIRGSYTFGDIEKSFGVPASELAKAFAVPADQDAAAFQVKSLEEIYANLPDNLEVGTSSVRYFVALYKALPFTVEEGTAMPKTAVEILKALGTLKPEDLQYLEAHTADLNAPGSVQATPVTGLTGAAAATPQPHVTGTVHAETTDRLVKGKTTFAEVLDWGVSQQEIETILGKPMPNKLMVIKTFCDEQGLEFTTIKTTLQAAVDKAAP